jgi:predicted MFS family arabinose efflux permease
MLPVVPLWAVEGGAGEIAAGATNGVFMLVTVLTQLAMPWLLLRTDHRVTLGAGTLMIGAPTPLFALSSDMWPLLVVSGLRGIGFGLLTVSGSALVAELVPVAHRGRAAALYGLSVGLPNIAFLPVGVWLARQVGFAPLFWIAGGLPVLVTGVVLWMAPVRARSRPADSPKGRTFPAALLAPWGVMIVVAAAAGGLIAFLPLAITGTVTLAALTVFGAATMLGRSLAGIIGDRVASHHVLLPAVLTAGLGMAGLAAAVTTGSWFALLGALAFGTGFGAVQNVTLVVMFGRAESGAASTAWNIAYDAGNGLGSVSFGALITATGYPLTFAVAAGLVFCCAPLALSGSRTSPYPARWQ